MTLRLGTRASKLALLQTGLVSSRLTGVHSGLECVTVPITTRGDEVTDRPLPEIGGKGVFTERIEQALRDGEIDAAVHSLKDLPVDEPEGLVIGAVLGRSEVRDALVARNGGTLSGLPAGAVVGTSSTRRAAQLLAARPDLAARSIRGNVETRIRRVEEGEYDATLLAGVGLQRLGLLGKAAELLGLEVMLPAPGQGAIAVQCRADDRSTRSILSGIDEPELRRATDAERGFLRRLGGGCAAPIAAFAEILPENPSSAGAAPAAVSAADAAPAADAVPAADGVEGAGALRMTSRAAVSESVRALRMTARVVSRDGRRVVEVRGEGFDPGELARRLADEALRSGGDHLLAELFPLRGKRILVTRALEQSAEVAERLSVLGATPIVLPLIRIEPEREPGEIDRAIDELPSYRWVLFTSVNGVAFFCDRIETRAATHGAEQPGAGKSAGPGAEVSGVAARALRSGPRIAAIGVATADALRRRGIEPDLVPETHTGAALAAALLGVDEKPASGGRVLLPRARDGGEEIVEHLRSAGLFVSDLPVYRTVTVSPDDRELDRLRDGLDAVLLLSGSAARAFAELEPRLARLGVAARGSSSPAIACIGPQTRESALACGLSVEVVADAQSVDGVIDALARWFREQRSSR